MSWNLGNDPKNTGRVFKNRWSTIETNSYKRYWCCSPVSTTVGHLALKMKALLSAGKRKGETREGERKGEERKGKS